MPCLPHTRGGVSYIVSISQDDLESSPHPWGCFDDSAHDMDSPEVFPTPVGVFPPLPWSCAAACRLPHTRGGVSSFCREPRGGTPSSPHPWGCFRLDRSVTKKSRVFPTPVGVFLLALFAALSAAGLPHTRGGVSPLLLANQKGMTSSPHPWGCFYGTIRRWIPAAVFPTPVGVFLLFPLLLIVKGCLPHTRGGVSECYRDQDLEEESSPHPWGCFRLVRIAPMP